MGLNKLFKGENPNHQRPQDFICRQLIDIAQCALHGLDVLRNTQFRFAGKVADAVYVELNVFLERGTGRKRRLVAALQTVEDQAATRCQHIAQYRHLRAAQAVKYHVHAPVVRELVDLHQQVLLFGHDHLVGAQAQQIVTLLSRFGRRDHLDPQCFAHLHERGARAMAGVSDQYRLPRFDPRQLDIREVGDQ